MSTNNVNTRHRVQHIKSKQLNKDKNGPLLPSSEILNEGEIAINYLDGYETLSIKNSNEEIATFKSDEHYQQIHSKIEKDIDDIEENYSTKTYVDGKIFVGTQEEYLEAWGNGLITVGALVVIVDKSVDLGGDDSGDNGDSGENEGGEETISILGKAIIGKMILGQK